MSDSIQPQVLPNLEFLRKLAKQTLKRLRAHDPELIGAMRRQIPQLAAATDEQIAASVRLADVHLGLARQYGFASWGKLKLAVEAQQPLEQKALRFLKLATDGERGEIEALLLAEPELARFDIWCAAAALNGA